VYIWIRIYAKTKSLTAAAAAKTAGMRNRKAKKSGA